MNRLNRALTECIHALLSEGRCTVDDVVERAMVLHGDLIDAESRTLAHRQVKAFVKKALADLAGNEDGPEAQQALPGLKLPSAIAVRSEESIYYVRADMARWSELEAGLAEREMNIVRAVVKRDQYLEAMDRLRPFMADVPELTVAEALRRERDQ